MLGFGSYETAWTWLHKLRRAMVRPGQDRLTGTVQVDESFIGGAKPGKRGRGAAGKDEEVGQLAERLISGSCWRKLISAPVNGFFSK